MDLITMQLSPPDCLLLRKSKISEEIKLLKDFVQKYKSFPEMKDKIMDSLQSLRRDLQDIESSMQCGELLISSNMSVKDQHHIQEITQQSMIGPDSNGFDFVRRIIKYGLNNIKDDILVVYEQEKCKSRRYIDKLPSRFSVTIERLQLMPSWYIRIWFVDDSGELRNMIIFVAICEDEDEHEDDYCTILKSLLVDWNIHRKICSMFIEDEKAYEEVTKNLNNWFNEGGSLPFIGTMVWDFALFNIFDWNFGNGLKEILPDSITVKVPKLWNYVCTPSNDHKFKCAVNQALSMGKTVTSQSRPFWDHDITTYQWMMGCKEAFSELEHIDPDFKFINFTKEDWDDVTLLCSGWRVLLDYKEEISTLTDPDYKTANENFIFRDIFSEFVQLRKSDNYYICQVVSLIKTRFAEYWKNSRLVLEIRVILDPRCKLEMVGEIYKVIYDDDSEIHLQKAIDDVTNIFNDYVKGMSSSSSSHDYNATSHSELDCYLRDEFPQDEIFDILQWWYDKSLIYPTLTRMAYDFLSIPSKISKLEYNREDEIAKIYAYPDLDDDVKSKWVCTRDWLNFFENN